MKPAPPMSRKRAMQRCLVTAATALTSAGLLCAAALAPAPVVILPFVVAVCIACPMAAACELPPALETLRHHRARVSARAKAVAELRAGLSELPETRHPLGF
jgi:hypothetical protein